MTSYLGTARADVDREVADVGSLGLVAGIDGEANQNGVQLDDHLVISPLPAFLNAEADQCQGPRAMAPSAAHPSLDPLVSRLLHFAKP